MQIIIIDFHEHEITTLYLARFNIFLKIRATYFSRYGTKILLFSFWFLLSFTASLVETTISHPFHLISFSRKKLVATFIYDLLCEHKLSSNSWSSFASVVPLVVTAAAATCSYWIISTKKTCSRNIINDAMDASKQKHTQTNPKMDGWHQLEFAVNVFSW